MSNYSTGWSDKVFALESASILQSLGDLCSACLPALRETISCLWGNAMERENRLVLHSHIEAEQELGSAVVRICGEALSLTDHMKN